MKIRAKANGNVLEMSAEEAQPLIDCGVFEKVEDPATEPAVSTENEEEESPRKGRTYKRRDVKAED